MGSFRIDLLDNSGNKLDFLPIISSIQVNRRITLDRIGAWEFDISPTDPALAQINGRDFDIYWQQGDRTYYLGRCSYLNHTIQAGGESGRVLVRASGTLRDLTRQTILARSFDGSTDDVNDVLSTIVPLRSGWALGSVDTITTAAPLDFWFETIFEGVALLAETFGYHFREGTTTKTLDFGAMGTDSGILAVGGQRGLPPQVYTNDNYCQITNIEVAYQSDQVINRLVPFGGAVGVATIDLRETTITQAGYAVQSAALPGGGSYHYIEDSTSQTTWGLTERRFIRKDLRPITNSVANREFAANVLYEAALASLLNLKDRQVIYSLSVTGLVPGSVKVGDKINVLYRGLAITSTGSQLWLDVDHASQSGQGLAFYVLEISESFGADGVSTQLTINENAVHQETIEDLLANTIRKFEQASIHVQPTITVYTVGPYVKRIDTSTAAKFSFRLGPETLNLSYAKMKLVGEPLKSSVQAVAAGGGFNDSSQGGGGFNDVSQSGGGFNDVSAGGGGFNDSSASGGSSAPTSSGGGEHQHVLTVYDDTPGYTLTLGNLGAFYGDFIANLGVGNRGILTSSASNHSHSITISAHSHNVSISPHSHTVSISPHSHTVSISPHSHTVSISPHSHAFTYGIFEDTVRPDSLTIQVNGSTVASGVTLSAPDYDYELDITDNILAAATLQQDHTISVSAGSGRGEIVWQMQILSIIQPIAVT